MEKFNQKKLDITIQFTETYKKYENEHIAIREAMCLKAQFPSIMKDIKDQDFLAGRVEFACAGFRYSYTDGDTGYFCNKLFIAEELEKDDVTDEIRNKYKELTKFWEDKTTLGIMGAYDKLENPEEINNSLLFPADGTIWKDENIFANYGSRMAEININFDKLLILGIPGMKNLVSDYKEKAIADKKDYTIYEAMLIALDSFSDVCRFYAENARKLSSTKSDARKKELIEMSEILDRISENKPETFREALQLYWLYAIIAFVDNYGRMDVYLGDFYSRDIDSGKITEEQAVKWLDSLYQLINETFNASGRIIIGGKGRRNEKNADRFALVAMETIKRFHWESQLTSPQLSFRVYRGMDREIYDKAINTISKGSTYPFLFNDDAIIPEIATAFKVGLDEAAQYVMSDCGEFSIDHMSFGSPNCSIVHAKLFEITLNNGFDPYSGTQMGLKTGEFKDFKTFDEFFNAYLRHVEFYIRLLSDKADEVYKLTDKSSCDLYSAMLFDDCLEKGRGVISGARYLGLEIETHGIISVADSLSAIKELVFEKKIITAETMLKALNSNFEGYAKEHKLMQNAPKYGNNDDIADSMVQEVLSKVHAIIASQAERLNYHFCVSSNISVDAYYYFGKRLGATPDGRFAGKPFTNGLNPLPGNDSNGITALLNSMAKIKPGHSGGQVNHIKFGSDMFTENRRFIDTLIETYFENGGVHLCIEALNKKDLENAYNEPEKYPNLMVRVGGFSARFVTLPREFQLEILSRTQY